MVLPIGMPLLTPEGFNALQSGLDIPDSDGELPSHFRWRVGWEQLAAAVQEVQSELDPAEQRALVVLATDFPTAGALEHFGPAYGLARVIGTHNSYWLWGPGDRDTEVALVIAPPGHQVLSGFHDVELASTIPCRYCGSGIRDEKIFLARRPIRPLTELWAEWQDYR